MGQVCATIFILTALLISGRVASGQDAKVVENGRKIFVEKRCYMCHTINGDAKALEKEKEEFAKAQGVEVKKEEGEEEEEKEKIGGDLSNVGKARDEKWLKEFLRDPRSYFKDTPECAKNAKKKYRKRFKGTDEDLTTLVTYLSSLKYEKQQEKGFESCLKE